MTKKSNTRSIAIWTVVALVGAVCWGVVALVRGEQISAVWLLGAAVGSYAIGEYERAEYYATLGMMIEEG